MAVGVAPVAVVIVVVVAGVVAIAVAVPIAVTVAVVVTPGIISWTPAAGAPRTAAVAATPTPGEGETASAVTASAVVGTIVNGWPAPVITQVNANSEIARNAVIPIHIGIERIVITPAAANIRVESSDTCRVGIIVIIVIVVIIIRYAADDVAVGIIIGVGGGMSQYGICVNDLGIAIFRNYHDFFVLFVIRSGINVIIVNVGV